MKKSKHSNFHKIVAFVLIAIVIISAVGFVVNGWQPILDLGANIGNINDNNVNADENNNSSAEGDVPAVVAPKFFNYLTGLETTEEKLYTKPFSFIVNPDDSLYGVSCSPLSIEFPTETGGTRMLVYSDSITTLGKIGSILPTRTYISNLTKYFGGALLSLGNDDVIKYPGIEPNDHIDLSTATGYHYTENTTRAFTNGDLVKAVISHFQISTEFSGIQRLPFSFNEVGKEALAFTNIASTVILPFSADTETSIRYHKETGKYIYLKGGTPKTDMLNTYALEYDNAFILFADSTTHETSEGTELILNTTGAGLGYYLTGGTYKAIRWVSDDNSLTFYDEYDNKLIVNRGTSYIAFLKATSLNNVIFS